MTRRDALRTLPLLAAVLLVCPASAGSATPQRIHVSGRGDDANPGTSSAPVATVSRAQELARSETATAAGPTALSPLRVWPNPARGAVQIEGQRGPAQVVDARGRVVATVPSETRTVDLAGLAVGQYWLRSEDHSASFTLIR